MAESTLCLRYKQYFKAFNLHHLAIKMSFQNSEDVRLQMFVVKDSLKIW